jgi:hypothetical protein
LTDGRIARKQERLQQVMVMLLLLLSMDDEQDCMSMT